MAIRFVRFSKIALLAAMVILSSQAYASPDKGYCGISYYTNQFDGTVTLCRDRQGDWYAYVDDSLVRSYGHDFSYDEVASRLDIYSGPHGGYRRY